MVRKYLVGFALALLGSGLIFAQDFISIQTRNVGFLSGNSSFSTVTVQSTWVPAMNGLRLRESDFYRIVGDVWAAEKQSSREKKLAILAYGGGAACITGIIAITAIALSPMGDVPLGDSPLSLGLAIGSGTLTIGGLGMVLCAIPYDGNLYDQAYAERLADDFNSEHQGDSKKP